MRRSTARAVYFVLQRLRGGVSPDMVTSARRILGQPWDQIANYVTVRLAHLHGAEACAPDWLRSRRLIERTELVPVMQRLEASGTKARVEHRKTSGSTGVPFHFVKDAEMAAWMDAAMWAAYEWHGVRPGDRQARFWGAPVARGAAMRRRLLDRVQNRRRLSAFRVSPANSVAFFAALRPFSPDYVYGYPTLIDEFVHHCSSHGMDGTELHLRTVICTGEILLEPVRERISAFFNCPVINEYGCTESGVIALECEVGAMHLIPVAALGEIVQQDGSPTPAGETGEVVVTDLYGEVAPFIRYRLHDLAVPAGRSPCRCGRDLPAIAVQRGRIDSFIQTSHRGPVYDAILAYTVPPEVLRFRVYQEAIDQLRAEIVPGRGFDRHRTPDDCRRCWEEALAPGVTVSVTTVSEIPLTAAGKLRYFVPLGEIPRASESTGHDAPAGPIRTTPLEGGGQ